MVPSNCKRLTLCLFLFAALAVPSFAAKEKKTTNASYYAPAQSREDWILERLTAGNMADLDEFKQQYYPDSPSDSKMTLSAEFVDSLFRMSNEPNTKLRTISIKNASISGNVKEHGLTVSCEVMFDHCWFNDSLNLENFVFAKGLRFLSTSFYQDCDFTSLRVEGPFDVHDCSLFANIDFSGMIVTGTFNVSGSHFTGHASFNSIDVTGFLNMDVSEGNKPTTFDEDVDFIGAKVGAQLKARRVKFSKSVQMESMTIKDAAIFDSAEFYGYTNFSGTSIGSYFNIAGAKFEHRSSVADFSGIKVASTVNLTGADVKATSFAGPVHFIRAEIAGGLNISEVVFDNDAYFSNARIGSGVSAKSVQFKGPTASVSFNDLIVNGSISFEQGDTTSPTLFAGSVDCNGLQTTQLDLSGARFTGKEATVRFGGAKVTGVAILKDVVFEPQVDFTNMEVGATLNLIGAEFRNVVSSAEFGGLTVHRNALFDNCLFLGPVDFSHITVDQDLQLVGTRFGRERAWASGDRSVSFYRVIVRGLANLSYAQFERPVSMIDVTVGRLNVDGVTWPPSASAAYRYDVDLTGIKCERIAEVRDVGSNMPNKVRHLVNSVRYSSDVYDAFRGALERDGRKTEADQLYIDQQWRQESLIPRIGWSWAWTAVRNRILFFLTGFGKRPWYALAWSLVLVGFGALFFYYRRRDFRPAVHGQEGRFNALLYSIDVFLPLINLQMDHVWKAKAHCPWLRAYVRFHTVAGWILVPIGILSITGVVR